MSIMRALRAGAAATLLTLASQGAHAESVKLTWYMWASSDVEVAAWKHVAGMVTAKYPDITVELQTSAFLEYWTKMPALAAGGKLPDIVSLQSLRFPGVAPLMEPLDGRIADSKLHITSFDPSILKALSRQGKQLALPYDFGPLVLYYNQDAFQKAGVMLPKPGWTEAEFNFAAKTFSKEGMFGIVPSVPDAFMVFARSRGARYLDDKGQLDLVNPGIKAAFAAYVELVTVDKVSPLLPASGTLSSTIANGRFTSGGVAMYVDGPWQLINLKKKATFTVGIAPVPTRSGGSVSVTAGSGFGIAGTSKHKDEAFKAITIMTGPEAEQYLAENGRAFPARSAFQTFWFQTAAQGMTDAPAAMAAALKTAEPYVTTPNWATVGALFEQYAPLAFSGSETPEKVLETIQKLASQ